MGQQIIYHMTDDLIVGLSNKKSQSYMITLDMINNFNDEDKQKICLNNIGNKISQLIQNADREYYETLKRIDDLMHFYYEGLSSYEIQYNQDNMPTGEIVICFD